MGTRDMVVDITVEEGCTEPEQASSSHDDFQWVMYWKGMYVSP